MPVIARLDGQVEEILIKPVGGRGPADEEAAPAPGDVPERRETPATEGDERARPAREDRRALRAHPLPVWLL